MQDPKELKVWEKSHQLTKSIYRLTASFPREELYGLTSQIRRASASIPANIAEGSGRKTNADFARFLAISLGSTNEVEYFLLLARDLKYLGETEYLLLHDQLVEIRKMLSSFSSKISS